jgi:hypothetical protein
MWFWTKKRKIVSDIIFSGAWPKMEKRRTMAKKTPITAYLTIFYSFLAQNR